MKHELKLDYGTFDATVARSAALEQELLVTPKKFRVLTGDRPTGALHVGHLFGSLQNRVRLQNLGVPIYIVIADYQVLTDRDSFETIAENVRQLTIDYLAVGINPEEGKTYIFPHSHVPELNQLLLPRGFDVIEASDGIGILRSFQTRGPDLVILGSSQDGSWNGLEVAGGLVGAPGLQNQCRAQQSPGWVRFPCTSAKGRLTSERPCCAALPNRPSTDRAAHPSGTTVGREWWSP